MNKMRMLCSGSSDGPEPEQAAAAAVPDRSREHRVPAVRCVHRRWWRQPAPVPGPPLPWNACPGSGPGPNCAFSSLRGNGVPS